MCPDITAGSDEEVATPTKTKPPKQLLICTFRSAPAKRPYHDKRQFHVLCSSLSCWLVLLIAAVPTVRKSPAKASETRASSSDPPSLIRQLAEKRSGALTPVSMVLSPSARSPASPVLTQSNAGGENGNQVDSGDGPLKLRRKSMNVGLLSRPRRLSLRRNSSSVAYPESRQLSSRSRAVRKVGEGALDDSDSSEDEGAPVVSINRGMEGTSTRTSFESLGSSTNVSAESSQIFNRIVSSPGLREDNEWAEDEREDSVSPLSSSNSESDNSVASTTAARSSSLKRRTRSRSSTLATLAASSIQKLQNRDELQRTDSHSSVLTVTAGGDKVVPQEPPTQPESLGDSISLAPSHKSRKHALPSNNVQLFPGDLTYLNVDQGETRFLEWNHLTIKESEELYRRTAWNALREVLEQLAENVWGCLFDRRIVSLYRLAQGDVQMCAMLACIAPSELKISDQRALQFIEGYIGLSFFATYRTEN